MKKGDIIICGAICAFAAVLAVLLSAVRKDGRSVLVKVNNETVYEYPIDTDRTISLEHNTAVIKNGTVYMEKADCKNQICVKTKEISKRGECIVCLPNRVIIEIK